MIPPGFIQDLLSRTDIVEVVGRHVELKKAGINHKGLCPFHGEKSPSFIVSPTRQTYHCFGCGVHGNAVGFLMEHSGLGFVEAVQDLAQQAGMQVPEDERSAEERERAVQQKKRQATLNDVLLKASDHYRAQLKKSQRAVSYLKKRGLTGQIAAQFALGYSPEGWRTLASAFPSYEDPLLVESGMVIVSGEEGEEQKRYDRFRDRIMFPIRNVTGETIGFGGRILDKGEPKYLNSPETPVFSKGRELYGLFEGRAGIRQRGYALVVEGYMDVVALAQSGFGNAVATLGTACTAEHVHKLFRFTESVVFSFDGDAAGRRAAGRALEAALPHATDTRSVKFLFLPAEHDPDSYVREFGPEAFERCVQDAVPLSRQLMDASAEGCDLGSVEGRARMLSNARPLWQALPQGLLKRALLSELAKQAQLGDQDLISAWQVGGPEASSPRKPQSRRPSHDNGYAHEPPPDYDHLDYGPSADYEPSIAGEAPVEPTERKAWKPKKEWVPAKDWKGKAGNWKRRGEPEDETMGTPRSAPKIQADHALRMLLLNSVWWEALSPDDQHMLHELPGLHGQLIHWLERHLLNHGAGAWSVLEAALAEDGLLDQAQGLVGGLHSEEEPLLEDLQNVIKKLWIEELVAETKRIAAANPQGPDLERFKQLQAQIQGLRAALTVASA
ncbi:DNA primase [Paucibacter sp. Y2R2-4]|uniref:DNA primase n=1 Tax=Paucibacter sp. Y2R2-4 TaxID=2893553 RepID=UPI0021E5062A|nr:DNA primase [Paucibacter sp. Y2R2-4]MCV2349020.1 DNA primase [Paucibacter sp. Y2R2-4]